MKGRPLQGGTGRPRPLAQWGQRGGGTLLLLLGRRRIQETGAGHRHQALLQYSLRQECKQNQSILQIVSAVNKL